MRGDNPGDGRRDHARALTVKPHKVAAADAHLPALSSQAKTLLRSSSDLHAQHSRGATSRLTEEPAG